jgi:hypothetical protein
MVVGGERHEGAATTHRVVEFVGEVERDLW